MNTLTRCWAAMARFAATAFAVVLTAPSAHAQFQYIGPPTYVFPPPPTTVNPTPVPTMPRLSCQRTQLLMISPCPQGLPCGPGDGGPGMSQLQGNPTEAWGVTGRAEASGSPIVAHRTVRFSYHVPDVRVIAPPDMQSSLLALASRTWVVKASEVPGVLASTQDRSHTGGSMVISHSGTTTTSGQTSTNGRWLLVGTVQGQAMIGQYYTDTQYSFSCELPVQNLN